jgi:hypothetical protein
MSLRDRIVRVMGHLRAIRSEAHALQGMLLYVVRSNHYALLNNSDPTIAPSHPLSLVHANENEKELSARNGCTRMLDAATLNRVRATHGSDVPRRWMARFRADFSRGRLLHGDLHGYLLKPQSKRPDFPFMPHDGATAASDPRYSLA